MTDGSGLRKDLLGEDLAARLLQLEKALDTMQVGVTITDTERRILYVNRAQAEMHGYSDRDGQDHQDHREILGQDAASLFAPPELRKPPMTLDRLSQLKSWRRESTNLRNNGSTYPVEVLSDVVVDVTGEPRGIVTISQDITARKAAEAALSESEERYALALRGSNDGLWDWNLETDEIFFSERWKNMLGHEDAQIGTSPEEWFSRVHLDDLTRLKRDLDTHLTGGSSHFHNEHRISHKDGGYRWMMTRGVAVRDADSGATRIAGSQTDITERKVHDPLTGLPNRALFLDRLASALKRSRRSMGSMNAVLFLDLDRFKLVNDSLGHLAGDQLLVRVARTLESCLRPGDTIARLGGDEFTILLEDIRDVNDALLVSDRIHSELADPFQIGEEEVFTTVSIGITLSATGLEKAQDLLRDADTAMYRAKAEGPGRHQLFDQGMRQRAIDQLRVETDLRNAIDREEFVLHYQPIITVDSETIIGFEALVRWLHPERGLVGPYDFIPTAEDTGLIFPLGRWILATACSQMRRWHEDFPNAEQLTISVNLSPKQFNHPKLLQEVQSTLEVTELEPKALQLEITESAFIDNIEGAIEVMAALRAIGVVVAIDDFGTGYSSLGYLNRFPVDSLKIDRSFIRRMGPQGKQNELVKTIIRMAKNLDIAVIAEGVETPEQHQHLKQLACGYLQGFNFSRPIPASQISATFLAGQVTRSR